MSFMRGCPFLGGSFIGGSTVNHLLEFEPNNYHLALKAWTTEVKCSCKLSTFDSSQAHSVIIILELSSLPVLSVIKTCAMLGSTIASGTSLSIETRKLSVPSTKLSESMLIMAQDRVCPEPIKRV